MINPSKAFYSISLILGFIGGLIVPIQAFGFALDAKEIRGDRKNNPVAVLQNRYFTKSLRPEIGVAMGSFLNEAYTDTSTMGYRLSLFVTEWVGVEYQSIDTSVKDSDDRKALNDLTYRRTDSEEVVSPDPEVNPIYGVNDVNLVFAPFYGKLNLLDQMILYSDLYLTVGYANVDTSQGQLSAATIGAGQRFYFLKSMSFRVDVRDRIYTEKRLGEDTTKHAYSIDFGLSYFFL